MGLPVLILGESGTGKSASLRNFPNDKVAVINVAGKPLPFKNKINSKTTDDYDEVEAGAKAFAKEGVKSIVVDDAQYLMANEFMRRATERGYDKFTDIAKNFWSLVNMVKELPPDVIVYFLSHIERDQNGNEKIKTIGKLLDEKITVEGMFTIVLKTNVTDGQYSFLTQNNGHDTVKSPIGMFEAYAIENDLYYVDQKIRNYYEMGLFLTDEEMKGLDKLKANENITKENAEEKKGRRSRKAAAKSEEAPAEKAEEPMNKPENQSDTQTEAPAKAERSRRTRKVREETEAANAEAVANAGLDEAGNNEEVPFDKVEPPKTEPTTRRRRRRV